VKPKQTREAWLIDAINLFRSELFKQHGLKIPDVRVSMGLPHGRNSKKIIGQCWNSKSSVDKKISIFITPTIDDSALILSTLAHELIHAHLDNKHGHKAPFKRIALTIGLEGKMTATTAGPELKAYIKKMISKFGDIPHARLNLNARPSKKQTTRMIKMECEDCGYIVRTAFKHIQEKGAVICPCNSKSMSFEVPDESEGDE
jgi:hypothetical protein